MLQCWCMGSDLTINRVDNYDEKKHSYYTHIALLFLIQIPYNLFGVKEKHVFLSSFKHHYSTFLEKSLKIVIFHQLALMTNNL